RAHQICSAVRLRLMIHTRQVQRCRPKPQGLRRSAQETDSVTSGGLLGIILRMRVALVVTHAAEHSRIGLQAPELADASIEWIALKRDQVTSHHSELRPEFQRCINHARELRLAQESAQVDIAELQHSQAVEVVRQTRRRKVDLAYAKVGALYECAVTK